MQTRTATGKTLLIYLPPVPFVAVIIAFAVGAQQLTNLPILLDHPSLYFSFAAGRLGAQKIPGYDIEKKHIAMISVLMIIPFIIPFFGITLLHRTGSWFTVNGKWIGSLFEQMKAAELSRNRVFTC